MRVLLTLAAAATLLAAPARLTLVVRVYQGGRVLTRQVVGSCGYLSHSSKTLHFGLGDSARIDRQSQDGNGSSTHPR